MNQKIPTTPLAPKLKISQILTGLWQIADMERDGQSIDLHEAAKDMQPYLDAGLTTFDMADHYGSAELIAGIFRQSAGEDQVQLLTKWVPTPGKGSKEEVRAAIQKSLDRLQMEQLDLLAIPRLELCRPGLAGRSVLATGIAGRRTDQTPGRDQF
jgi:aryl-alcohol dehydrogenase-like predicted oxidoreductase